METRTITPEQKEALDRRLPDEAVSQHPTKKFLSSIKSIYVTERLNEVFGVGSWRVETEIVERSERMVVVKLRFSIPEYGIYYECFGGNDNADLGDACKGATTDALTKVCSWLGIGAEVFKGRQTGAGAPPQSSVQRLPAAPDPSRAGSSEETDHGRYAERSGLARSVHALGVQGQYDGQRPDEIRCHRLPPSHLRCGRYDGGSLRQILRRISKQ